MTQTVTLEQIPESCHRILVGFSGGADSTALLCLLLDAQPRTGFRVFAVHVNHGLRGDESDADEAFVRAFCTQHEVPLQVFRLSLSPGTGENEAREARYACFREAAQQTGADAIALAHHRDDQAETLLLHLMRGSGLDGLGGPDGLGRPRGLDGPGGPGGLEKPDGSHGPHGPGGVGAGDRLAGGLADGGDSWLLHGIAQNRHPGAAGGQLLPVGNGRNHGQVYHICSDHCTSAPFAYVGCVYNNQHIRKHKYYHGQSVPFALFSHSLNHL